MKRIFAILIVTILSFPAMGFAQSSSTSVDPTKLGVSLDRIKRELVQAQAAEQNGDPLRLDFHVEVIGRAPRIDFLEGFDLDGALPYGAPTHREFLEVVTPQEFRAPAASLSNVVYWVAQQLQARNKRSRCEREIAEYRAAVLQGIAVTAPRCTQ